MAISKDTWKNAKFLFSIGKSLSFIHEETNISRGQLSKVSKREEWEKETQETVVKDAIIAFEKQKETMSKQKETLVSKLAGLEDYKITLLEKVIDKETEGKSLFFDTLMLGLIRKNEMLTTNKTYEKINVGDGIQQLEPRDLNAMDYKNLTDATHKDGVALGFIDIAPKNVVNNQNAQQNNQTKTITYKVIN